MNTAAASSERGQRFAWAITGSGHFVEESIELAARLPDVDIFLSKAGEEVLPLYHIGRELLKQRFRVFRDKSASAVPVGMLYEDIYHTLVIAPATSNTVAKSSALHLLRFAPIPSDPCIELRMRYASELVRPLSQCGESVTQAIMIWGV